MLSMTGHGYAESIDRKLQASIEIKSYNNRYKDINVSLPPFLSPIEPDIRDFISAQVQRGKIEIYCRIQEFEEDSQVLLDTSLTKNYLVILNELAEIAGSNEKPGISHLLSLDGVLKLKKNRDIDVYWNTLKPLLEEALEKYQERRAAEGEATQKDIENSMKVITDSIDQIEILKPEAEQKIKDNIRQGFEEVLGNQIDENRILQELAAYLVRYNINEEIARLKSHIQSFQGILNNPGPVGKKLDFLCQEIHREINTIGSKSVEIQINSLVVSMKDSLEMIREQLRNVE